MNIENIFLNLSRLAQKLQSINQSINQSSTLLSKKHFQILFAVILLIFSICIFISCENPWMKDILDPLFKEKSIIPVVWIRPSAFIMGSPVGEDPLATNEDQHQVRLTRGFYMSKYQVTQEQYQAVMGSNPSYVTTSPEGNSNKLPVEKVSWYDAIVFCNKLSMEERLNPVYTISGTTNPDGWGPIPTSSNPTWNAVTVNWNANGYRLPTEAEWEYACRGGTTTAYSYGNTANPDYMWYDVNSGFTTHEVGKKLPNPWGLYDMHGNVFEWCWDWYVAYETETVTDPRGPASGGARVRRGGCWRDDTQSARSAYRINAGPWISADFIGIRLVRQ